MEATSKEVMAMLAAGLAKAEELSEPSCVTVVDRGGNIQGFARSDDAMWGTAEVAISKAYTTAAFKLPNGDLSDDVQPGAECFNLETAGRGRTFTCIAGGLPLVRGGQCIGAVAASGGPVEHDVQIANAMLSVFEG